MRSGRDQRPGQSTPRATRRPRVSRAAASAPLRGTGQRGRGLVTGAGRTSGAGRPLGLPRPGEPAAPTHEGEEGAIGGLTLARGVCALHAPANGILQAAPRVTKAPGARSAQASHADAREDAVRHCPRPRTSASADPRCASRVRSLCTPAGGSSLVSSPPNQLASISWRLRFVPVRGRPRILQRVGSRPSRGGSEPHAVHL